MSKGQSFVEMAVLLVIVVVIAVTAVIPLGKTIQTMGINGVQTLNAVSNYALTQESAALSSQGMTGYNKSTASKLSTVVVH